jgi:hypothetical protein
MDERLPAERGAMLPPDGDGWTGGWAVATDRVEVLAG